jgi:predicted site-specific integrase-resolvase
MRTCSTREAAKKLGITGVALGRYIKLGKILPPLQTVQVAGKNVHAWTEAEIEQVRKLLPKIANGRKTRYKKQSTKTKKQKTEPKKK